jgi:hypothetical protein
LACALPVTAGAERRCPPADTMSEQGGTEQMANVIIGVDPHKRSTMIEVIDQWDRVIGQGRLGTDQRRDRWRQRSESILAIRAAVISLPGWLHGREDHAHPAYGKR